MKPQITHEDFFLFLIAAGWLSQTEYADCLSIEVTTLSRNKTNILNGKSFSKNIIEALITHPEPLAEKLIAYKSGQSLTSVMEMLCDQYSLRHTQETIVRAIRQAIDERSKQKQLLRSWIGSLHSRRIVHTVPVEWDIPNSIHMQADLREPPLVKDEDRFEREKSSFCEMISAIAPSNVLLLLDEKEERVLLSDDNCCIKRIVTQSQILLKEFGVYSHHVSLGICQHKLSSITIENLNILINGYTPDQYYGESGLSYSTNRDTPMKSQNEVIIHIPILPNDRKVQINMEYTLMCHSESGNGLITFHIAMPCKEIEHSYILHGLADNQYEMSVYAFLPLQNARQVQCTSAKFANTVIIVRCFDWEVPGAGYIWSIRKRKGS